jgi:purine-binding chemotaxis protein CheW
MSLHVVFKVAGSEYALPASEVLQMESFSGATRVPGAPDYVEGLVQVRGRVVPVINLRARFGLPPADHSIDSRIVVGQVGERAVALLVDSARDVIQVAEEQIRPPPPLVAEESGGVVRAIAQVGKRLLMIIDVPKVVGEERFHGDERRQELA